MNISAWVIFGAIIFVPINIAAFSSIFIFRRNRRGRRTPLTGNLLRGTGESLRTEIKGISEKLSDTSSKWCNGGFQDGTFDMSITRGSLRCNA